MRHVPVLLASPAAIACEPALTPTEKAAKDRSECNPGSLAEAAHCDGVASCSDVTLEAIDLPALWRVDFAAKQLASADGARTSPITALEAIDAVLLLQGQQNGRGWTLVIERATGHLSSSAVDAEGAFVLAGPCTPA